ncbi:prepilin-type N-terminal cleavage/methylation domain-containing protein [Xylophilus sp. Kf1]|nr:prepilin-type N-terminal cleavage/methylation domain-containing protein [Xylophilus sp. Kf1]
MRVCRLSRPLLARRHRLQARRRLSSGMTLVELMVAMVLGLLIAVAAIATLTVARSGFATVDSSSQLRDSGRFAADLIGRIVVQGGFQDLAFSTSARKKEEGTAVDPPPNVSGFNNAYASATDPLNTKVDGDNANRYSDVLIVRYQSGESFPGSGVTDRTMINCQGDVVDVVPATRDDRVASVFHVAISNGEPSLMCTTMRPNGTVLNAAQPIVQGVETFQVLYGVDGVVPNTALPGDIDPPANTDRYLRADQMVVGSAPSSAATNANWRRVRSIRIGLVLRSVPGSSSQSVRQTMLPFGKARSASTAADGSALSNLSTDPGSNYTVEDARLRQVVTFTVHLRNAQDLGNPVAQP